MTQQIYQRNKDMITKAIQRIADPISKTMSPKGQNVAVLRLDGTVFVTNDGDKIRRNIQAEDAFGEAIIRLIKDSADRTHQIVGDARSSTITLTSMLSIEALKLIEDGINPRDIADNFNTFKKKYIEEIKKLKTPSTEDDLFHVAKISANNDDEIAKNTIKTVKIIGEHGMAFLDMNKQGSETVIEEESGYNIKGGLFYKELLQDPNIFSVIYKDVPMLITDKRLYYLDEAESIISTVKQAGYNSVVIVAREFIKGSDAVNSLVTNHTAGNMKVCMVTDTNVTDTENETLYDLSAYVDGKVITERAGDLVKDLTIKDFVIVKKVYQDPQKTLITPIKNSRGLKRRIQTLQEAIKKKENKEIEKRLASLTTGNVNIFVGGSTVHEIQEKMDRYRDAINATKRAMTDGFVVGGGVTLMRAFKPSLTTSEYENVFRRYSEKITRQIAENCNQHTDTVVQKIMENKNKYFGYNALTNKYEDLLKAGVLEPLKALEMVVENSISTAITLSSIATYIINKEEEKEDVKK